MSLVLAITGSSALSSLLISYPCTGATLPVHLCTPVQYYLYILFIFIYVMVKIDVDSLRSPKNALPPIRDNLPRLRKGEPFLKGPIPMNWLNRAACLKTKALQVGIAIWYLAGVNKNATIALTNTVLSKMGIDRFAKRRALEDMEAEGLIDVERKPGRNPRVTILGVD